MYRDVWTEQLQAIDDPDVRLAAARARFPDLATLADAAVVHPSKVVRIPVDELHHALMCLPPYLAGDVVARDRRRGATMALLVSHGFYPVDHTSAFWGRGTDQVPLLDGNRVTVTAAAEHLRESDDLDATRAAQLVSHALRLAATRPGVVLDDDVAELCGLMVTGPLGGNAVVAVHPLHLLAHLDDAVADQFVDALPPLAPGAVADVVDKEPSSVSGTKVVPPRLWERLRLGQDVLDELAACVRDGRVFLAGSSRQVPRTVFGVYDRLVDRPADALERAGSPSVRAAYDDVHLLHNAALRRLVARLAVRDKLHVSSPESFAALVAAGADAASLAARADGAALAGFLATADDAQLEAWAGTAGLWRARQAVVDADAEVSAKVTAALVGHSTELVRAWGLANLGDEELGNAVSRRVAEVCGTSAVAWATAWRLAEGFPGTVPQFVSVVRATIA